MTNLQNAVGQSAETSFIERLARQIGITANAKYIYGEPVERGGVTVITVGKAVYGFGGGSGSKGMEGGSGAGGGVAVMPVGYIEIKNGETRFRPLRDPFVYAGLIAALAPVAAFVLWRLTKAFGKGREKNNGKSVKISSRATGV
jgi:uncharacterized spore protein YtfJ